MRRVSARHRRRSASARNGRHECSARTAPASGCSTCGKPTSWCSARRACATTTCMSQRSRRAALAATGSLAIARPDPAADSPLSPGFAFREVLNPCVARMAQSRRARIWKMSSNCSSMWWRRGRTRSRALISTWQASRSCGPKLVGRLSWRHARKLRCTRRQPVPGPVPVLVENSAASPELGFHAVCLYSLISPASLAWRRIPVTGPGNAMTSGSSSGARKPMSLPWWLRPVL